MVTLDIQMESEVCVSDNQSSNGKGIFIEGRVYQISCPRFKDCIGPKYNLGFIKYFCSYGNHHLCATENPDICIHENFAKPGERAKFYPAQLRIKEMLDAGEDYA